MDSVSYANLDVGSTIADAPDSNMLLEITPSMMQKIASLPQFRREKILGVWERLVQGTYDIDERLDAVIDRILAAINT